jgi:hypothetical protein
MFFFKLFGNMNFNDDQGVQIFGYI